ncbi:MAG: methyltransferase domain-containing protein [Kangiellaceae bacterium]|nr:methyltransferase domain-containing protein [Kangiellaceae bacterium]
MNYDKFFDHPIIDVRSEASFFISHIKGAANFPAELLEERMHELPLRSVPLNLYGSTVELECAHSFLKSKGYSIIAEMQDSASSLSKNNRQNYFESGNDSPRLWNPSDVVSHFCSEFEMNGKKTALDLACGSGRDSLYLTMQGWRMTSVDYSSTALKKLSDSAQRLGLCVETLELDIEKDFDKLISREQSFDAVLVVRYLHRPILHALSSLIADSGYIIYQTFMRGAEVFGSPRNPRYLLEKNELAEVFKEFDILVNEVCYLPDGRPTNRFIAKKKIVGKT